MDTCDLVTLAWRASRCRITERKATSGCPGGAGQRTASAIELSGKRRSSHLGPQKLLCWGGGLSKYHHLLHVFPPSTRTPNAPEGFDGWVVGRRSDVNLPPGSNGVDEKAKDQLSTGLGRAPSVCHRPARRRPRPLHRQQHSVAKACGIIVVRSGKK